MSIFDTQSAGAFTVDDMMTQALGSVLGGTPFASLQPFLQGQAYSMLGLAGNGYRDALLDTVLFSNMTPYGTAVEMQRRQINRVAADALKIQQFQARTGFFQDLSKTAMSYDSWAALKPENAVLGKAGYENYIQNQAMGMSDNFLWSTMYQMLDPDGIIAAGQNLQQAGANVIRRSRTYGRRNAFLQARAVGNLFTDEQGNYSFDAKDYGFMDVGEASAVAAALTKDLDFFGGTDPKSMEDAAKRLKDQVQAYTKALAPLKDVFGKDVPAMINAIEDLSGQKLSQMSSVRVQDVAQRVMAGAAAGNYNLGQLSAMTHQVGAAILGMNVPYINDLGALAQSQTILSVTEGGLAPAFMSKARFDNMVTDATIRASNSRGADMLNLAYSAWKNEGAGRDGGTMDKFMQQYNTLRETMGTDKAILAISGTNSLYQLEQVGARYSDYASAVEANLGGQMALGENLDDMIEYGKYYIDSLEGRTVYDRAVAGIKEHPEWLSNPELAPADLKGEIYAISYGKRGDGLAAGLQSAANRQKYKEAYQQQTKMMESANNIKGFLGSNLGSAVRMLIGGKMSANQIREVNAALSALDPEDQKMIQESSTRAISMMKKEDFATTEDYEKAVADQVKWEYNNGVNNLMYMDLTAEWADAHAAGKDTAEIESRMNIVRNLDQNLLGEYLGAKDSEGYADRMQGLKDFYYGKGGKSSIEATDFLRKEMITKSLMASKFGDSDNAMKAAEYMLEQESTATGSMTRQQLMSRAKGMEEAGMITAEQRVDLESSINKAYGPQDQTTQITDLFGSIGDLVKAVGELVGVMKKDEQKKTEDPAPAQPSESGMGSFFYTTYRPK